MKWILVAVVALLVVAALIAVIGALLPRDHVASRSASFRMPPKAVFALISDVAAAASWRRSLTRVELLPAREGKPSFREISSHGALTFVIEELKPPERIVTRIVDNAAFGGTWTYELSREGAGSRLTITEHGEVYNPIFRFVGRFFLSQTATMDAYLADLQKRLGESG